MPAECRKGGRALPEIDHAPIATRTAERPGGADASAEVLSVAASYAEAQYAVARAIAEAATGPMILPSYAGSFTDQSYLAGYVRDAAASFYGIDESLFDTATIVSTSLLRDFIHRAALQTGDRPLYRQLDEAGIAPPISSDVAPIFRWPARGDCALFAHQEFEVFRALGYEAALVGFLNGEFGPFNTGDAYTNSHVMAEVYVIDLGKSIVQDAMLNATVILDGQILSLQETRAALWAGQGPAFDPFDFYYFYEAGDPLDTSFPPHFETLVFDSMTGIEFQWRTSPGSAANYGTRYLYPDALWLDAHIDPPAPGTTFDNAAAALAFVADARAAGEAWLWTAALIRAGGRYAAGFQLVPPDGSIHSSWITVRLADGSYRSIEFDSGAALVGSLDQLVVEAAAKGVVRNPGVDLSDFLVSVIVLGHDGMIRPDWEADDSYVGDFVGTDRGDNMMGSTGIDRLEGGLGNDVYYLHNPEDTVFEAVGGGSDRILTRSDYALAPGQEIEKLTTYGSTTTEAVNLTGNEFANAIVGNDAANVIDGKGGADVMWGYAGNDTYYVDNAGDTVAEAAGGGSDLIITNASHTLGAGQHIETLTTYGSATTQAVNLTGNELANTIVGNAGANSIDGKGGADTMYGYGGADTYYVDNAGDKVAEAVGGGSDRVLANVSYTLAAGQEVEQLATYGSATTGAINLTGNRFANILVGNAGANVLDGKFGADAMYGHAGNDTYHVDNALDTVIEAAGGGSDTVIANVSFTLGAGQSVELLRTYGSGSALGVDFTGNAFANAIVGDDGDNSIDGKAGSDTIWSYAGIDLIAFTTPLGAANVDTLGDFQAGLDRILLDDAIFTGLAAGALGAGAFRIGAAAVDADDRIIYNSATGALLFDVDGLGGTAALQFATLGPGLGLAAGDFTVI